MTSDLRYVYGGRRKKEELEDNEIEGMSNINEKSFTQVVLGIHTSKYTW